jgi:hypothetical protein
MATENKPEDRFDRFELWTGFPKVLRKRTLQEVLS